MLGAFAGRRYFLYRHPTDMRKGFSGLSGLVINEMGYDHLSGDAYIFINKRRTLIISPIDLPTGAFNCSFISIPNLFAWKS